MSDEITEKFDRRMSLWVLVAIGITKQSEHTVTDILSIWFSVDALGVDLTAWTLYGFMWTGALAVILTLETLE